MRGATHGRASPLAYQIRRKKSVLFLAKRVVAILEHYEAMNGRLREWEAHGVAEGWAPW